MRTYTQRVKSLSGKTCDSDRKNADRYIRELGATGFAVREKATKELKKMGQNASFLLEKTMKETDDPEVKTRCKDILDELAGASDIKEMPTVIAFLKTVTFTGSNVAGKYFIMSVTTSDLQRYRYRSVDGSIHEHIEINPMVVPQMMIK